MSNSTTVASGVDKPPKPYAAFPLYPHNSGHWCKTIRGKLHYFGPWGKRKNGKLTRLPDDGWQAALNRYESEAKDLHAGRKPKPQPKALLLKDLCNRFLTAKKHLLEAGEIVPRTFAEYKKTTDLLIKHFGSRHPVDDIVPEDWGRLRRKLSKTHGPTTLCHDINKIRVIFKWGWDETLCDRPRYGQSFKRPDRKAIRKTKRGNGKKMFEAEEIRKLLKVAPPQAKAWVLLGINAGIGNADIGRMTKSDIDLSTGWLDYPRHKTQVERRCPLWPETIKAIKEDLKHRPKPSSPENQDLVFLRPGGGSWYNENESSTSIGKVFRELCKDAGVYRPGRGFYTLRHVLETVGGESRDQAAVNVIMGHEENDTASIYREGVSDERLQRVVDTVHDWLFKDTEGKS